MKILQLCNKPPFPPVDGGTQAMNSITTGLLDIGNQVRVLSVCSDKHPVRTSEISDYYLQATRFEAVPLDLDLHPTAALAALLCGKSYHVSRFESKAFADKLVSILDNETFDIIHLESLYLTPYVETIRQHSNAVVVLRAHNVEHHIWESIARQTNQPLKRWYLNKLTDTLRRYELERLNTFDGIACITQDDANYFQAHGCTKPLTIIPFGMATHEMAAPSMVEPYSLFHIGSMDWIPNQESIRWFLQNVWPKVHNTMPLVRLYLAGRKMPQDLMDSQIDGVTILGEVSNANLFITTKQINIVPLLSGSGIRVKIIEAMAAGKTVISTTIGAQGIEYTDQENILIANTPEEFVTQIQHCVNDSEFCCRIGKNAHKLIETRYSIRSLTHHLIHFYTSLLEHQPRP